MRSEMLSANRILLSSKRPQTWPASNCHLGCPTDGKLAAQLTELVYDNGEADVPPELLSLLSVDPADPNSLATVKRFVGEALILNRALAMGSLVFQSTHGLQDGLRRLDDGRGPPCIKCGGQIYTSLGAILESEEHPAKYAQLYTYDKVNEGVAGVP